MGVYERILKIYKPYGKKIASVIFLKALSYASLFVKNLDMRLNLLVVAPAGNYKTVTSKELKHLFVKKHHNNFVTLGSDTSLHGISRIFPDGNVDGKLFIINDLTFMLSSLGKRSRTRIINAFGELLSDGFYQYNDFRQTITLKGKTAIIFNVTYDKFKSAWNLLIKGTFGDRCLIIFYKLSNEELERIEQNRIKGFEIPNMKLSVKKTGIKNYLEYSKTMSEYANKWKFLTYSSRARLFDKIKALVSANAVLNGRDKLNDYDFKILEQIEFFLYDLNIKMDKRIVSLISQGYSIAKVSEITGKSRTYIRKLVERMNTTYNEFYQFNVERVKTRTEVIKLYKEGKTPKEICELLGKPESFMSSVYRIIREYDEVEEDEPYRI